MYAKNKHPNVLELILFDWMCELIRVRERLRLFPETLSQLPGPVEIKGSGPALPL